MFADVRTEWRVNDIERSLRGKAESHEVSSLRSDVDGLERTIREMRSLCDGLRFELETYKSELNTCQIMLEYIYDRKTIQ